MKIGCTECGHVGVEGEFHPFLFCMLKKQRIIDPWATYRESVKMLLGVDLPSQPPMVRDLPLRSPTEGGEDA